MKWYGEQIGKNLYLIELDKINGRFLAGYLKSIKIDFIQYGYNNNIRFIIQTTEKEIITLNNFIDELTEN